MLNRIDIDSTLCLLGGGLIHFGLNFDAFRFSGLSVEALIEAEKKSILEVQWSISEHLYITPLDCFTILGGIIGTIGLCGFIARAYKSARKWYNAKSK